MRRNFVRGDARSPRYGLRHWALGQRRLCLRRRLWWRLLYRLGGFRRVRGFNSGTERQSLGIEGFHG